MTARVRSELLKLRTTRTLSLLLLAAAALTVLGAVLEGISPTDAELAREATQREMFGAESSAVFFATFAGVIAVTSEFRYRTIDPTLLSEPRRLVVLKAKLIVAALMGAVIAAACVTISFTLGHAIAELRDVDLALTVGERAALVAGTVTGSMLSAMIGVAVGMLIRNQVGAVLAVAAYAFAIDAPLFAAVPSLGRYLPGKAGDGLIGMPDPELLAPLGGAAFVLAWTLAFVGAAAARFDRSDV
jgi:ABC-2 type transport system permease protein